MKIKQGLYPNFWKFIAVISIRFDFPPGISRIFQLNALHIGNSKLWNILETLVHEMSLPFAPISKFPEILVEQRASLYKTQYSHITVANGIRAANNINAPRLTWFLNSFYNAGMLLYHNRLSSESKLTFSY